MISVIVSTRNRPEQVARCVRSILAAATPDMVELIVVDQSTGPVADLEQLVAEAGGELDFKHIRTDTVGVSRSRNIGLAAARGGIVAVTDDDCVVDPGWIHAISAAFAEDPAREVVCGRILPFGEGPEGTVPASVRLSTVPARFSPTSDPSRYGSGGNFAARRDLVLRVGGYDEAMGPGTPLPAAEDIELLYRLLRHGAHMDYLPQPVVYHEAWRTSDELVDLSWSYSFGAGVYLAREVVARRDRVAFKILAGRILNGLWLLFGSVVLAKPWQRRYAWQRVKGHWDGLWAVLSFSPRYGITRAWVTGEHLPLGGDS